LCIIYQLDQSPREHYCNWRLYCCRRVLSSSGQLLANKISVYTCYDGHWTPLTPLSCFGDDSDSNINTGIVVGCTVGALVCLAIILFAIFIVIRTWRQNKEDDERDRVMEEKMQYVREYTSSVANWNCSVEEPATSRTPQRYVFEGEA